MVQEGSIDIVRMLMSEFADRTGLPDSRHPPRRYLWTDSFAVCNFLELYRQTAEKEFLRTAQSLVEQVHEKLGRHRDGDPRTGWISGLGGQEGLLHPTVGGLRIGKRLGERGADEPLDDRLEWDRDGQYFHYSTKWMHALARLGEVTEDPQYLRWAIELAQATCWAFTRVSPDGGTRMYWKMSIDLSRPLVASMGQHDPLDGLLTFRELRSAALGTAGTREVSDLESEIAIMEAACRGVDWTTSDVLGLGGLLSDAYRIAQLQVRGEWSDGDLLARLLQSAAIGLTTVTRRGQVRGPASNRLAFREFGLSIGLEALKRLRSMVERMPDRFGEQDAMASHLEALQPFESLGDLIEAFWIEPKNQRARPWLDHIDINSAMLATSLAPDTCLKI